ncbi:MAG: protoporphyrinogen oxidase [Terriglobales bacterium]
MIVIVGSGISGLAAAWALDRAGEDFLLLEADTRPGGVISTGREDGFVYEGGPDSFLATKPAAVELCQELGLTEELIGAQPQPGGPRLLYQGRMLPLPAGWRMLAPTRLAPLLRSPLLSPATKTAVALHWSRAPVAPEATETAAAYLERRFGARAGRELARTIVQPLAAGVYGGAADQLSAAALQPRARRGAGGPVFLTLRGGMEGMVAALTQRLRARVRTRSRVARLLRRDSGYLLALEGGEIVAAEGVIVALPAWQAADLLQELDLALASTLAEIPYASSVNANLAFRTAPALPAGHGFLVAGGETTGQIPALLACTFAHQKFAGRAPAGGALLRLFYGESATTLSDEGILARARADLHRTLGVAQEPDFVRLRRAPRAMPQYTVGHAERLRRIAAALVRYPRLALAGNAFEGVGVPDCIASGRSAATGVLRTR